MTKHFSMIPYLVLSGTFVAAQPNKYPTSWADVVFAPLGTLTYYTLSVQRPIPDFDCDTSHFWLERVDLSGALQSHKYPANL
ncbi:hypothetical protein F5B17DRAFT_412167, partial [Nemania serpens]